MPFNANAQQRVVANRARMRNGRTVQVAAIQRSGYGGYVASTISIILKQKGSSDPETEDQIGTFAGEYLAELDLSVNVPAIAYLALTPNGATDDASIAAAQKLEIVQYRQSGLVPDRWQVSLRRLR